MSDPKTLDTLADIVQRESRSFLQYVGEAFPWANAKDNEALTKLQQMIEEEARAPADLAQFLVRRQHYAPYLSPYPASFTSYGFVSLRYLLPILIERQRQAVAALDQDLARLSGDPEARERVQTIADM